MHKGYYSQNTSQPPLRRPPPRSADGTGALMAGAQGSSFWVGPTTPCPPTAPQSYAPPNPSHGTNATPSNKPKLGAANRIPLEIALQISKYLDVRDLGRAAQAWRSITLASTASPEFIRLECARYSLVLHGSSVWSGATRRAIRERMQRYNFAWSTLLYSAARFVNIPQMTASTPWAGSHQWRSGNRFTGESNGYIYDVSSWAVGSQFQARVSLHRLPSLRAGHGEVTHFDVPLRKHFAKAVAVDPVKRRVAILEFDNNRAASGEHSSFPTVHVCTLDGQDRVSAGFKLGLKPFTEIYHMELYKDTVCFVGNFPSSRHPNGMESNIVLQNWKGARRWWGMYTQDVYCTGFQFITEDLFIMTTREKPSSYEFRQLTIGYDDAPYSSVAWAGHVRLRSCNMVTSNFADPNSRGRTPTGITLVRNNSPYGRARGPFYSNPTTRLFGLKYHYNEFDGSVRSSVALFGQTTVESWLEIAHTSPTEPIHWVDVPRTDTTDMRLHPEILTSLNDASNLAGWAIIGRRLFWGERWLTGWGLHLVDYNPGAGAILAPEGGLETHGALPWMSVSARLAHDPYPVVHTATIPMGEGVKRLIATEDGILAKLDLPDANFTMMLM